jgi:hypothetical protein
MVFWSLSLITSVVVLVLSAAMRDGGVHMAYAHFAISAAVSISFALIYVRECENMRMAGARQSMLDATAARFSGIVWTWGALALSVTYGSGILVWREWMTFFITSIVLAGACFVMSDLLRKDAVKPADDVTMLKVARYLTIGQFLCMLAVMVGLVIDGKMTRYLNPRFADWAANNIFFFGALALAAISGYALNMKQRVAPPKTA